MQSRGDAGQAGYEADQRRHRDAPLRLHETRKCEQGAVQRVRRNAPNGEQASCFIEARRNSRCATFPRTSSSADDRNRAGATAQCKDGAYSHSKDHRGACSHHGGVAQWL